VDRVESLHTVPWAPHANSGASFWGHFRLQSKSSEMAHNVLVTGMAGRNYEQCLDHLKQQNADLMHIITPIQARW